MEDVRAESVGYIKFRGEAVADGTVGADAAGTALLALDECLKYFNRKQARGFANLPYEIPVQTTKGSWEVWVLGGLGVYFVGPYLKKAAEKMAENDFKDIGFKDVLRKSVGALKTLVELIKHTGGTAQLGGADLSWRVRDGLVGVMNSDGELLLVPLEYFQWYLDMPPGLMKRLTQPVETDRTLAVGVRTSEGFEEAEVTALDKEYFGHEVAANEDDLLFPEMEHGQHVRLEGRLTRGNANTNTVGLEYEGHVLNCVPEAGSIKNYKPALFLRCVVEGVVSRLTKQTTFAERKPTIVFSRIIPLEADDQGELFGS